MISIRALFLATVLAASASCTVDSAKSRYILAEKLWNDGNYAASVVEFERVVQKDPRGKLGVQALFRAAMTQSLYLGQHSEAIRKFKAFTEISQDPALSWEAQKQIGEILYTKLEQYEQVIQHYRALLKAKPDAAEDPEFLFRIAKSHFFLWQFDEAIGVYREIQKRYPNTPLAEKSMYEVGVTHFTRGSQVTGGHGPGMETYQEAMDSFEAFLKKHPKSDLVPQARFGIASCLEELDQLDAAYHQYESLLKTYPSPKVIEIKLARIKERKAQRSR